GEAIVTSSEDAEMVGHGRMKLWKQSLKMIPARPIFGYGPEHMDDVYSKEMWILRPDNEFIQHAVFLGVPAALFYITALVWLFLHQWKHMKQLDRTILIAAGCVIAYLVSSMFGVTAFYTTPYLYLFWGMAAGRPTPKKSEEVSAIEEVPTIEEIQQEA
ncbi:MAG: O-antigen ligase family protein, partial [Lachnospiraceae bacterium]|nr:O-antigen ligase family protein [Lachnospiraceae bacterium]